MDEQNNKQFKIDTVSEPEVVFKAFTDKRILAIQTENNETIMEISGYDLQVNTNCEKLNDIVDVENLLDGIKDLFRKLIMQNLLESKTNE